MRRSRINNYLSKKYNRRHKTLTKKNNYRVKLEPCEIINVHGEKVILPTSFPGNLYVHIFLNPDRHYPIESFNNDYFGKLYRKYRIKCYGK